MEVIAFMFMASLGQEKNASLFFFHLKTAWFNEFPLDEFLFNRRDERGKW